MMTGSGDPPPAMSASASRWDWSGDGGTPSTLKPTIFMAGAEALLSMLLLPVMAAAGGVCLCDVKSLSGLVLLG